MTLSLDHTQRLNLMVLLGMLECNVGETRAVWKLQDQLGLTDDEKQTIGYSVQSINGNEVHGWDLSKGLPVKEYNLADSDLARIQKAIQLCPQYRAGMVRQWLEPLLEQLPETAQSNGTH